MGTGAGFEVSTEVLTAHAGRLEAVRDAVDLAADAAGQVDLSDGSFGVLCAFLPPIVLQSEAETEDAIAAAGETLTAMAQGVRDMAADYAAADEGEQGRLDRLRAALP
ncbi:conserved hypothetical protein [Beutenbergia cavernae DSM 12333]|uniref:ESX-1 secretion-associated protein n=1 Tax=Beutenbergia cavernae (strain ATCC BAA-8 / DSM 12333 / CCUG 43141 / JCM 11478 / NBRC 16432 / NCIMB 13614 / HKI 0122) TaxID=471853 RepID=C5C0C1_BEUC1|nr:type VII secretion target [Beutenbergia cavernae]ACQ79307.1 conserved hypothetical protein [Beutenbergia cavernae DSM 12333]